MLNLYSIAVKKDLETNSLTDGEKFSIIYHNIFDYPLNFTDIIKWKASELGKASDTPLSTRDGHFFVEGKDGLVYKRQLRKRISAKKIETAKKVSRLISAIPTVKMVALTGSLAMENAVEEGDIDFLVVTSEGSLWITRLLTHVLLQIFSVPVRRSGQRGQKDGICLNMWIDESRLKWDKARNFYTAHEIAQVVPLTNKNATYERFLSKNRWILDYWPNSVRINKIYNKKRKSQKFHFGLFLPFLQKIENVAFRFQYHRMKKKMTRESVSKSHAFFHPEDWGSVVLQRLSS